MKKFISLSIVLTMMLSVFYCFPAEARVYDEYPYIYLDFEENNLEQLKANNEVGTNLESTWTPEGANSTKGCISLDDKGDWANNYYYFKEPLRVGQTYRASVWVKITTENILGIQPKINFILYTRSHDNHSAVKTATLTGTPVSNEWVHCTGTFVWDGMAENEGNNYNNEPIDPTAAMHVAIRVCGSGSSTLWTELKTKDEYKDDDNFVLEYDMDDIVVEPTTGADEPVYDDSYVVALDFEDGTTGGVGGGGTKQVVTDPERGKVLENVAGINVFDEVVTSAKVAYNHLYKVSFWVKRTDDLCDYGGQHSRAQFITWLNTRQDTENITKGTQYPAYFMPNDIAQNEWKYVEFYQKFDVKTFDNKKVDVGIRIGNNKASQYVQSENPEIERIEEGEEGVTVYIDDFFIQDLGFVQNGDFEAEQNKIWQYTADPAGKEITQNVFGWNDENATSSISTEVRSTEEDPESTSTQSMSVDIAADGGRVWQGVNFENQKEYKITFWAKGLEMEDGEEKPISIMLDRKVDTVMAQDVYEVPDLEELGEEDWTLTNQWKKYEYTFSPNYTASGTPGENVIPRTPFLYFDVDGNKAGTKFLIDDLTFVDTADIPVEPEENIYPRAEDFLLSRGEAVSGSELVFTYNYVSEVGNAEGNSVIRALISEDGKNWGCIGQSIADFGIAGYTIPDSAIGKQLKIELAPMDNTNQMGEIASVELGEVKRSFELVPEITEWDEESGEVAANVHIENNSSTLGELDVVLILAIYDENNTLLNTEVKHEMIDVGYNEDVKVSAISTAEGAKAILYVWSGTSIADAGAKNYCEPVVLEKGAIS